MIKNFLDLIFPNRCFSCSKILSLPNDILCLGCANKLPFSQDFLMQHNFFKEEVAKNFEVESAFSLFNYPKEAISRTLIHELKYNNKPRIGKALGEVFIAQTIDYFNKNKVDVIVYVPITKSRKFKRGYNQLEEFSKVMHEKLKAPVLDNLVYRDKFVKSQIKMSKEERVKNLENVFKLNVLDDFKYKHILILDDVYTTGATFLSLANCIKEKYDVKISLGVMVYNK